MTNETNIHSEKLSGDMPAAALQAAEVMFSMKALGVEAGFEYAAPVSFLSELDELRAVKGEIATRLAELDAEELAALPKDVLARLESARSPADLAAALPAFEQAAQAVKDAGHLTNKFSVKDAASREAKRAELARDSLALDKKFDALSDEHGEYLTEEEKRRIERLRAERDQYPEGSAAWVARDAELRAATSGVADHMAARAAAAGDDKAVDDINRYREDEGRHAARHPEVYADAMQEIADRPPVTAAQNIAVTIPVVEPQGSAAVAKEGVTPESIEAAPAAAPMVFSFAAVSPGDALAMPSVPENRGVNNGLTVV